MRYWLHAYVYMSSSLKLSIGQFSDRGLKEENQDFHGVCVPEQPALTTKGIAVAVADGISSSKVSRVASQTAIRSFLEDYYCTSDSWTVKSCVDRVLLAVNSWLFAQNQRNNEFRFNKDKGYVCTFTAMVFKSTTAHVFHVGDARVYKLVEGKLEQLTEDHRVWLSEDKSYLGRALGVTQKLEIDYAKLPLEQGDVFLLATDGVYEYIDAHGLVACVSEAQGSLDDVAKLIVEQALAAGSDDNVTLQLVRVDQLPEVQGDEVLERLNHLPFPPLLKARMQFDGYEIIRELYVSSRSHVLLARDSETQESVVIKTPSVDCRDDSAYLERFLMEEWIANRLNNAHILKSFPAKRKRNYIYTATEYIEGRTLAQWMIDNPKPSLEAVRDIVEQVAKGLQAFHRQEMLHQDLRPQNIMIDGAGTVKIIDFGSTFVAGIQEISSHVERQHILGTVQFTAPEYFLGEFGTRHSDLYSLGCIAYQMFSGRLPYGTAAAKAHSRADQRRLVYQSVRDESSEIPAWVDDALRRSVHPDPLKRQSELSEFVYEMRQPSRRFLNTAKEPLMDRNPVLFWQGVSFILAVVLAVVLLH
ncbi:bifunctional protein-serine/threonine kinase/phosphatase [Arenicella sp. 4NH20-0111]